MTGQGRGSAVPRVPLLADLTVVDLSRALAGPYAAMMLGDLGARVIKVENPNGGDDSRSWGPPFAEGVGGVRESVYFLSCNRNKESVTIDLRNAMGVRTLRKLVRRADVVVENFRPGFLQEIGFSVEEMRTSNERLIVLSISGFGPDGPEADRPGYDQIAQGESGLMSITGPDPTMPIRTGVPIADLLAGIFGVVGVLAALHRQALTGQGDIVRTSLFASVVGVHAFQGARWTVSGEVPQATGNHHPTIAPYGMFRASDGVLQLCVGSESLWHRFASLIGIDPLDVRFRTNSQRMSHHAALVQLIEDALSQRAVAEVLEDLRAAGVPAGRIRTIDEVYGWEQTIAQGLIMDIEHSVLGRIRLPGSPLRFDYSPGQRNQAPPMLGQHTEEVLRWLEVERPR